VPKRLKQRVKALEKRMKALEEQLPSKSRKPKRAQKTSRSKSAPGNSTGLVPDTGDGSSGLS
jgi:hypothetical protein